MGNVATIDEHIMISIHDMMTDLTTSGGESISSIELEDTLCNHSAVAEVAVILFLSGNHAET